MNNPYLKLPKFNLTDNQIRKAVNIQNHAQKSWDELPVLESPICIEHPDFELNICVYNEHLKKSDDKTLIIPIYDIGIKLWNYQILKVSHVKNNYFGGVFGRIDGCFHAVGKLGGDMIITTDFLSAYILQDLLGITAIATFPDEGHWNHRAWYSNLKHVCKIIRYYHPDSKIIVAGNNNMVFRESQIRGGYGKKRNIGRDSAIQAAKSINASLLMPLNHRKSYQCKDFYEMWALYGEDKLLSFLKDKIDKLEWQTMKFIYDSTKKHL